MNNLWQHPVNRKWYSDIQINGRRMRRALSFDRREAERLVDDMRALRHAGRTGEIPRRVSWDFFKGRLYESMSSEGVVQRTIDQYKLAFRRLEYTLHLKYLEQLTPERLDFARSRWIAKDIKKWAIENHVRYIKAALKRAEDWKFIGMQNWRIVKRLPANHRKLFYTPSQLSEVIEKSPEPFSIAMRIMGRAGLRSGEVIHLCWSDCDMESHLIHIRKKEGWQPKTKRNICRDRDVPMSDDLFDHLKRIWKPHHSSKDLILGGQTPMRHNKYWYEIKKCLRAVGLTGFPHAFRHTLGSHLSQYGREDIKRIAEIMGHSPNGLSTTAIYTHSDPESMRKTIDSLPSLDTGLWQGYTANKGMRGTESA